MKFKDELLSAITEEARKLSLRYHAYHNALELEYLRRSKRVADLPRAQLLTPLDWKMDRKFDPFYVHKHRKAIAHSIAEKIEARTYWPGKPIVRSIAKPQGGFRDIRVYQIPDAAVSSLFYRILLRKNRHRFSASSYAYRDDKNVHFAIQDIAVDLAEVSRVFVAEYDFSKFFDSISHEYLFEQFSKNGFSISPRDEHIVGAFLSDMSRGVPQGTSISLFLANLVCWRLDKDLERVGLKFARYADDTVVWSTDYSKIARAVEIIAEFSKATGVHINQEKSKGIRLLCPREMPAEFAERTDRIEFLGYSIGVDKIAIKQRSVEKIKRHISYLLYRDLIRPLRGPKLKSLAIPSGGKDEDLVACLSSIRRYLYGNLSEEFIRRYLAGSSGRVFYKGVMSYYPLLSDKAQMQELDGWLTSQVWKALRIRCRLLKRWRFDRSRSFPFNLSRADFVDVLRKRRVNGLRLYSIPSFVVIYLVMNRAVSQEGVQQLLAREEY